MSPAYLTATHVPSRSCWLSSAYQVLGDRAERLNFPRCYGPLFELLSLARARNVLDALGRSSRVFSSHLSAAVVLVRIGSSDLGGEVGGQSQPNTYLYLLAMVKPRRLLPSDVDLPTFEVMTAFRVCIACRSFIPSSFI
ncbi:hypothetical protein K523DRAFT_324279 [Schizophyllum commune Tattone D]|nr:hypothetical protein K523DRAFT_324279 [Schizophyllum commune Tattone D]